MKKVIVSVFVSVFLGVSVAHADAVKVPTHNWSSQLVGAQIVGKLFEMVGEEVEYVPMDSQTVYQAMCDNDIDIVHEVWQGAFGLAFEKVVNEGLRD